MSTTCIAAHAAGIPIFCTGGIGGVHRDYIDSMDVSADLNELSRTPVAVISSGVKSILDIGKTLEYLETLGVGVYTLENNGSKQFPAFFSSASGFESTYNCRNEKEVARIIQTNLKTGLGTGLLIGVPIPAQYSVDPEFIEKAINEALLDANRLRIKGKNVTPFLLERINQITKGQSLASNVSLIKNNAKTSAKIAIELHKLNNPSIHNTNSCGLGEQVTVIGGINLDNCYKLIDEKTIGLKGVTQPCEFYQALGGVGRNMAEALNRFGIKDTFLISSIGDDLAGRFIRHESNLIGMDTSKWLVIDETVCSTGSYNAVFDPQGELLIGCGDMRAHDYITPQVIEKHLSTIRNSLICVLDADVPIETIKYLGDICWDNKIPIWFNPTDLRKATKIIDADVFSKITYMSPNLKELFIIFKSSLEKYWNHLAHAEHENLKETLRKCDANLNENLDQIKEDDLKIILKYLVNFVPFIFLSRGDKEMLLATKFNLNLFKGQELPTKETLGHINLKISEPSLINFPIVGLNENEKVVNVTGAGDSASAGIITGITKGYSVVDAVYNGLLAAKFALMTHKNVSVKLDQIDLVQVKNIAKNKLNQINKTKL